MSRRLILVSLAMVLAVGLSLPRLGAAASPDKVSIAVSQEPGHFDVSFDSGGATAIILENINEFLIKKETSGKHVPGLATLWTISPDGKTVEFTLRKGVKFHSGDPLTTKDVAFSFERARKNNRWMKSKLRNLDKIDILDDYRIKFIFKQPDVPFIPERGVTMIVSKSYYDRVGEDKFQKKPVGTGPYKIVEHKFGQYVDIERFEDYWGKKPKIRSARFYFVPEDTTRVAKLQAGEVDLIQGTPFSMVNSLEKNPNLKTVILGTNSPPRTIMFSTQNPNKPWYDKKVRLAMAHAIDADTIIKKFLFGLPKPLELLMPSDLGYDTTIKLNYPYDPEKAKKLLAEAGYPNGFDFNLYFQIGGRSTMDPELVQAVASYFGAVGLRPKIVGQERSAFLRTRQAAKKPTSDYVAYISGSLTGVSDPTMGGDIRFSCDGSTSAYCNPEFDKVLSQARSSLDETKRAELIKKMAKILYEDVACIPIFANVAVYGIKKNLDFVPTQYGYDLVLVKDITVK